MRHSDLRDLTANMVSDVCKDTEIEPKLTPLTGEELQGRTSNNSNEARVDIGTRGFWERGQQAFFDLRVFDPNACRYRNKSLQQCHVTNEQEKKRAYNQRIIQIDHGTFTPLVFSINGSMARKCSLPQCKLKVIFRSTKILKKNLQISFCILRSSKMKVADFINVNQNVKHVLDCNNMEQYLVS